MERAALNAGVFASSRPGPLPDEPPYNAPSETHAGYLVKDEKFHINAHWPFPEDRWNQIVSRAWTLWVLGYVDYLDVFGQKRRAGFAGRYDPAAGSRDDGSSSSEGESEPSVCMDRSNSHRASCAGSPEGLPHSARADAFARVIATGLEAFRGAKA